MLRIPIGSISETGYDLDEQVDPHQLPLLSGVIQEGNTRFVGPVHVRVDARLAGESVLLEGRLRTTVSLFCSRCVEPFEQTIEAEFSVTAIPEDPSDGMIDADDEIELTADEMNAITYLGDSVDLRDEIAQQVIMALPFKPLCDEFCKGLCSHCGANLNRNPCRCRQQDASSPFAVLRTLSLPPKKD